MAEEVDWWTVQRVADRYGVTRGTVHNWRKKGYGPGFTRVGGHWKTTGAEVEAFDIRLKSGDDATAETPVPAAARDR
jgi:predicted site-specific integrase-resolvase